MSALLSAGLLRAAGEDDLLTDEEEIAARLVELLGTSGLWVPRPLSTVFEAETARGELARWVPPGRIDPHLEARLERAWAHVPESVAVRIAVDDVASIVHLRQVAPAVNGSMVVPSLPGTSVVVAQVAWPLRIVLSHGFADRRHALRSAIQATGSLFVVELDIGQSLRDAIAIVDVESRGGRYEEAAHVVQIGGRRGRRPSDPRAIGARAWSPDADLMWLTELVDQLARDLPFDVAMAMASPGAVVVGPATDLERATLRGWLGATGGPPGWTRTIASAVDHPEPRALQEVGLVLRRWRRAPFRGEPPPGTPGMELPWERGPTLGRARLRGSPSSGTPLPPPPGSPPPGPPPSPVDADAPGSAASAPSWVERVPSGRARRRRGAVRDIRTVEPEPPGRRLVTAVSRDGTPVVTAFAPEQVHQLSVTIAVPQRGELATRDPLDEAQIPDGEGTVSLVVDVHCPAIGLDGVRTITLPTTDRTLESTTASFDLHAGVDGTDIDVRILVLHRGRVLQAGRLLAPVRARPGGRDSVRLLTLPLSSIPEPRAGTTAAAATLVTDGLVLRRQGGGPDGAVSLHALGDVLRDVEGLASRVLADDDPPADLADERARELLVRLARWGTELRDALDPLDLPADASTIEVLVQPRSVILPLELVYDGPVPASEARACRHAVGGSGGSCTRASRQRVCPDRFWGLQRRIARTFVLEHDPPPAGSPPTELRAALTPVLYAAARRADRRGGRPSPSDRLAETLGGAQGAASMVRVTSWRGWRRAILDHRPGLLVILAHSELQAGEMTLEIGRRSRLARPDIGPAVLRAEGAPPPVVVLLACASAVPVDTWGGLPAAFAARGAGAVVATLTRLTGRHGAVAAAEVVTALREAAGHDASMGTALVEARRRLLDQGLVVGLLLVGHGEIDLRLEA